MADKPKPSKLVEIPKDEEWKMEGTKLYHCQGCGQLTPELFEYNGVMYCMGCVQATNAAIAKEREHKARPDQPRKEPGPKPHEEPWDDDRKPQGAGRSQMLLIAGIAFVAGVVVGFLLGAVM